MTEKAVRVDVTNVDEDGSVTLDKVAPHPSVLLTATLTDPDGVVSGSDEWQWSRSRSKSGSYPDIEDAKAKTYTPTARRRGLLPEGDGYIQRRRGRRQERDGYFGPQRRCRRINEPNAAPAFPDQDADDPGLQNTETTRMVGENADAGANVGAPVVAEDEEQRHTDLHAGRRRCEAFKIDAATGQITVGAETRGGTSR